MFPVGFDIILFIFGLAFGSFFNVLTMRYDGERTLGDPKVIGGRSHCPHCHHQLGWAELVPVVSFVIQGGRCLHCRAKISWIYPIVELATALIFVLVPAQVSFIYGATSWPLIALTALWIVVFSNLLIMALVDIRLGIIPDELTLFLILLGLATTAVANGSAHLHNSFFGIYASSYFGFASSYWGNHFFGALFGVVFLGALWLITRGKGMGMGDVKLALPLGLLFGWPDILFLAVFAFVIGAIVGVIAILTKHKTMASSVPFGPFLAAACVIVFFFGVPMMTWYFHALGF